MGAAAIEKFDAPRMMYIPNGRGSNVRKQMLLDEISRIEKVCKLI